MDCVYCGKNTRVINSRHQKKSNQVWRRRRCTACQAVFTTLEAVDTNQALRIHKDGRHEPFSRDTLLISVYNSLRHRKTALQDATGLTGTIVAKLYPFIQNATIDRDRVAEVTTEVLKRFDKAAATHYKAFHP